MGLDNFNQIEKAKQLSQLVRAMKNNFTEILNILTDSCNNAPKSPLSMVALLADGQEVETIKKYLYVLTCLNIRLEMLLSSPEEYEKWNGMTDLEKMNYMIN